MGKVIDWEGNRGIILADPDEGYGDSWFFFRRDNVEPYPEDPNEELTGQRVAFFWGYEKEKRLATDVLLIDRMAPKVFFAHSSSDKAFVRKLAASVKKSRFPVWLDEWELLVGDSLTEKINQGLSASSFLALVLSKASVESPWVRRELSAALMQEIDERRVIVLPVLLETCDVPPLIRDKYYADFRSDFNKGLCDLINSLKARQYDL